MAQFDPEFERIARVLPRNVGRPTIAKVLGPVERAVAGLRRRRAETARLDSIVVDVYHPTSGGDSVRPGVLYVHGGGFVIGTANQSPEYCQALADDLGAVVVAPEYRLAPAHPFPTPLEDCHDALEWLAGRDDVDAARIALVGASAGGGLAAQLALFARERGTTSPCFQALIYPMLDDRTTLRTDLDESGHRLWNNAANRFGWRSYLGCEPGRDDVPPIAAPSRHPDLSDLPAAWIGVGELDLFHDEDVEYARRLRDAGVECTLEVVEGVFHGFDVIRPNAAASKAFRASMIEAIGRHLRP